MKKYSLVLSSLCHQALNICLMAHVRARGSTAKIDSQMPGSSSYKFIKLQSSGLVNLSYVSLLLLMSHPPLTTVVSVSYYSCVMLAGFFSVEDLGCAGTCLWANPMLGAVWRLQIPACGSLQFQQLVWTDE